MGVYTKKTSDLNDIVGQKFCNLEVLELIPRARSPKGTLIPTKAGYPEPPKYLCQCECGKQTIVNRTSLLSGRTRSCGCLKRVVSSMILKQFANKDGNISKIGCMRKNRACGKHTCCWDCEDYEGCKLICSKSPNECGKYRGGN